MFFREGKGGRKRGREISVCGCLSHAPPTGDLAHNPGMCPDWESNRTPFGSQTLWFNSLSHTTRADKLDF